MRKLEPKEGLVKDQSPVNFFEQYSEGNQLNEKFRNLIISNAIKSISIQDKYNFYPLIGSLLSYLGFNCKVTRDGDTNNRADAVIIDDSNSIPIEIKSPTEVPTINIKSVRQAVENKVVLLSRGFFRTHYNTTTLAIGFAYPADRSDVTELIENIFSSYKINVGLMSLKDLLENVWETIINNSPFDKNSITNLKGVWQ